MDYHIRRATPTDAANLAALSIEVWLDTYATDGIRHEISSYVLSEFTEENMLEAIADPNSVVLIAEKEAHAIRICSCDARKSDRVQSLSSAGRG